jgi:hypothetical protein
MPQQQPRCTYCNEPSTLLCDFKLGWAFGERVREKDGTSWLPADTSKPPYTCDVPMCRKHAEQRGGMHVRFSQRVNGRRGFFDTIDHCLEHAGQSDVGAQRILEAEAERLRRVVRERAQRRALESGVRPDPTLPASQGTLF